MKGQRVFISSRISEMRDFREAAICAIDRAGMETVFVDSTDANKRFPLKRTAPLERQLLEAVRSSDVFVGLYGNTLEPNWIPPSSDRHIMELEYEAAGAAGLPQFCYIRKSECSPDDDMIRFRSQIMGELGVEFLSTPEELEAELFQQLTQLTPKIFISYSSSDEVFVNQLYRELKLSGHHPWLNTESIPKGKGWYEEMVDGLDKTSILLLVLSPDSVKSKWVKQEWETFLKMKKLILPVLYRNCISPKEINQIQMIKADRDCWYDELLKAIETNL